MRKNRLNMFFPSVIWVFHLSISEQLLIKPLREYPVNRERKRTGYVGKDWTYSPHNAAWPLSAGKAGIFCRTSGLSWWQKRKTRLQEWLQTPRMPSHEGKDRLWPEAVWITGPQHITSSGLFEIDLVIILPCYFSQPEQIVEEIITSLSFLLCISLFPHKVFRLSYFLSQNSRS